MRRIASGMALLALCATVANAEINVSDTEQNYLEDLYLHLHKNPELSLYEYETAARMAEEFAAAGYEVTTEVGGTGVVGLMRNGDGPTVMIRGDMDGLPVEELTGVPYASQATTTDEQGRPVAVMHACGHDIHMTNLIGVARKLSDARDSWRGTVVLVAQPAEERGLGARAMIEDGLFTRFPRPDYNLGLHVTGNLPAGRAGYRPEFAMANVDSVDIIVHGTGGHGAAPHLTHDPIVLSAYIVTALQTLVGAQPQSHRRGGGHGRLDSRRNQAQHHLRPGRHATDRSLVQRREPRLAPGRHCEDCQGTGQGDGPAGGPAARGDR